MSSLLKDMYSPEFYEKFSVVLAQVLPSFEKERFKEMIFSGDWEKKELKDRMRHTAVVLHEFLPANFAEACRMIEEMIVLLRRNPISLTGFEFMFFPDYIERYGLNDYDTAVRGIEAVTQFTSCEFAVRPFILKYGEPMIEQMVKWSGHENADVRRLSSEGIRPRLPWAMALPDLKKNPAPILPILENLKCDPSESVRRSVANNLNDIAKDNPGVVLEIARRWSGVGKDTDGIVRHGCRTLLKQGHPEILELYGLDTGRIEFSDFRLHGANVKLEEDLRFSFVVRNVGAEPQMIRLEYAVFFKRKSGEHSKKVFKISERVFQPGEQARIEKKQSFRQITTRRYYSGEHRLSAIVNGKEQGIVSFVLTE